MAHRVFVFDNATSTQLATSTQIARIPYQRADIRFERHNIPSKKSIKELYHGRYKREALTNRLLLHLENRQRKLYFKRLQYEVAWYKHVKDKKKLGERRGLLYLDNETLAGIDGRAKYREKFKSITKQAAFATIRDLDLEMDAVAEELSRSGIVTDDFQHLQLKIRAFEECEHAFQLPLRGPDDAKRNVQHVKDMESDEDESGVEEGEDQDQKENKGKGRALTVGTGAKRGREADTEEDPEGKKTKKEKKRVQFSLPEEEVVIAGEALREAEEESEREEEAESAEEEPKEGYNLRPRKST